RLTGRYTEAVATLKEAVSRSPNLLAAHANLAGSYWLQWASQLSPDSQTLALALEAAQRVIALNESSPWGHAILGYVYLWQKQYEQAIAEMERAIAVDPNLAEEMMVYIRRFLRYPQFNTHAKRLGKVIKVTTQRIEF